MPGFECCSIIWVLFDDDNIGKNLRHQYNHLKKSSYDPKYLKSQKKFSLRSNTGYQIQRRQFPLRLSAAKTIHKSQGSRIKEAVVDFGTRRNFHMWA